MIIPTQPRPQKKTHGAPEANIQAECFSWFWNTYPEYRGLMFAVTNQNERSGYESGKQQQISGMRRRMIGVVAGVSDLVCLIPRGKFHGIMLECKTALGRQSECQKCWERLVVAHGYHYAVFRSLDEFKDIVGRYLGSDAKN